MWVLQRWGFGAWKQLAGGERVAVVHNYAASSWRNRKNKAKRLRKFKLDSRVLEFCLVSRGIIELQSCVKMIWVRFESHSTKVYKQISSKLRILLPRKGQKLQHILSFLRYLPWALSSEIAKLQRHWHQLLSKITGWGETLFARNHGDASTSRHWRLLSQLLSQHRIQHSSSFSSPNFCPESRKALDSRSKILFFDVKFQLNSDLSVQKKD